MSDRRPANSLIAVRVVTLAIALVVSALVAGIEGYGSAPFAVVWTCFVWNMGWLERP